MTRRVAVRFSRVGRVQYFDAGDMELFRGTHVIVDTDRGREYAEVALPPEEISPEEGQEDAEPLKPIIRIATKKDDEAYRENMLKEKEAFSICEKKIAEHGLNMRLAGTDITFDGNKMIFYFTADARVDFRELVKDLASCFHTRIELRQIGVRDETKIIGGLGTCGRELCCAGHLTDFAPVTIKMAKDQGLSLNPSKISGACGRLMCCLRNEEDTYEYLNSTMPKLGDTVVTDDGLDGDVTGLNIFKQQVKVIVEINGEREERILKPEQLSVTGHRKYKKGKEPVVSTREAGSLAAAVAKYTKDKEDEKKALEEEAGNAVSDISDPGNDREVKNRDNRDRKSGYRKGKGSRGDRREDRDLSHSDSPHRNKAPRDKKNASHGRKNGNYNKTPKGRKPYRNKNNTGNHTD